MKNKAEKTKIDYRYFAPVLVGVAGSFVQAVMVVLFLIGVAAINGERVSVIRAVIFIAEVTSVNSAIVYRTVSAMVVAVFYFLFLAVMIKNIVVSLKDLPELAKSRYSPDSRRFNSLRLSRQMYECFFTFELFCIFTVLVGLAGGETYLVSVIPVMVLTGFVFLGRGVALHIFQFGGIEDDMDALGLDLLKDAIVFAGICLTFFLFQSSILKEFVSGFFMFISSSFLDQAGVRAVLGSLYARLIYPASFLILLVRFFVFSHEYLPHCMRKREILPRIKKVLVFVVGFTIFHLVAVCLLMWRFDWIALANWFAQIRKSYLPLTILYGVLFWLESHYKSKRQIS